MRKVWFALAAAFVAPFGAMAVDGVVLINQSTVMAAGGFPYRITQPGISYKLSGSLVAPAGQQAILFAANNVMLDLAGFSVTCSFGTPSVPFVSCVGDAGASGSGVMDVSIRNGVVAMTQTSGATFPPNLFKNLAVGFRFSTNLILEDVHIEVANVGSSGLNPENLDFGANSIIRHNVFSASGNGGGVTEGCPSLIEGNVNATGNFGTSGAGGCTKVNNVGAL